MTTPDGSVGFRELAPGVVFEGAARVAGHAEPISDEALETPRGAVRRLVLRAPLEPGPGLDLELEIEIGDELRGVVLTPTVSNSGAEAVALDALELTASDVRVPGSPRVWRAGFQSWSPSGWLPLEKRDARPRPGVIGRMHHGPYTPRAARGRQVSDWVTTLGSSGHASLTVGALSHRVSLSHVEVNHSGGRVTRLVARSSGESVPVEVGDYYAGERFWFGIDPVGVDGRARWAELTGREMEAPVPAHVGTGWCSWYQYFTRVSARDIQSNVERLAPLRGPLETVQIDDGFQHRIGDWLEPDTDFPGGVAPLAAEIRGAGFRAGLWLAPLLASRTSKLARNHPDWLLRDARGKPVWALVHGDWDGRFIHALDPTHPDVISWLGDLARSVRGMGFDYLKLDFLYAGTLAGARHDAGARSAESYRRSLRAIRYAAGGDAYVLGCGAPLGPSVGLVDAMRIGPNVAPRWTAGWRDLVLGLPSGPAARNSIRSVLARASWHQRLWVNDPDCVLVRDSDTDLSTDEVESLAGAVAISGGLAVASDDLAHVSAERRDLLRRLLPPLGGAPDTNDGEGEVPDEAWRTLSDGSVLVYRVNLGSRRMVRALDPARYGLTSPVYVYDVWADQDLGEVESPLDLPPTPPRASRLLRLTPADGRPRVVGSSLHVGAGALETRSLERSGKARARLEIALSGERSGRLLVAPTGGTPVSVRAWFEDRLSLEILSGGVVKAADMDD